jgi:hypothetical protein
VFDRRSPTLLRAARLSGSTVTFDTNIRVARKGLLCAAIRVSTDQNEHVEGTESYPGSDKEAIGRFPELDIRSSGLFSAFFGENFLLYRPYVLSMYRIITRFRPQRSKNRPTSNLKSVKTSLLHNRCLYALPCMLPRLFLIEFLFICTFLL